MSKPRNTSKNFGQLSRPDFEWLVTAYCTSVFADGRFDNGSVENVEIVEIT